MSLLKKIASPKDVKKLPVEQLPKLCDEIREFLISSVSKTGGHLASNLGVVELSVAIHKVFDSPNDKIIFDVGHQSYTHKILTGRKEGFDKLRKKDGLSGYPCPIESEHDIFIGGHSSTSISVGLGISTALKLNNSDNYTIVVIGDGSFTGGMVYEAINNAGRKNQKLIIILNHNEMSISKNVGSFAKYLSHLRSSKKYYSIKGNVKNNLNKIPVLGDFLKRSASFSKDFVKKALLNTNFFEDMGLDYLGPVDGHNINELCDVLEIAKTKEYPVLIQVDTIKGKGYANAELNPGAYHGVSNFDLEKDNPDISAQNSYSNVVGKTLDKLAQTNDKICAVTAAMKYGTGLQFFAQNHKTRFFDVGIAEQHAVTFCAALASQNMIPVFCVYSSFLQRGFDQLINDASIYPKHLVLAIDRAGIVGEDGKTHQGIFDVAFLSLIPNMKIFAPSNYFELVAMLEEAINKETGLVAVRYPKGEQDENFLEKDYCGEPFTYYKENSKTLVISYGKEFCNVYKAKNLLAKDDIQVSCVKLNAITPFEENLFEICLNYSEIYFYEEGIENGGVGQRLISDLVKRGFKGKYYLTAINEHIAQNSMNNAIQSLGLDASSIVDDIKRLK